MPILDYRLGYSRVAVQLRPDDGVINAYAKFWERTEFLNTSIRHLATLL